MDVRPNGHGFADIRPYSTRPAASQWSTLLAADIKTTKYTIPSPALLCRARLGRGRLGSGLGEGLEGTYTPRSWTSEENVAADMLHLLCSHYISMGRVHEHVCVGVLFAIFWCEFENPFMNPNTNRMLCACEHDLMRQQ